MTTTTPVESNIMLCVTHALKEITQYVYFDKSQTVYPRINCDLRKFEETDEFCRYRLVLDYLADDGQPVTVVQMHELARGILNHGTAETEDGAYIRFVIDSRGDFVDEPNPKIVHYVDSYEVTYWKNKDI